MLCRIHLIVGVMFVVLWHAMSNTSHCWGNVCCIVACYVEYISLLYMCFILSACVAVMDIMILM